jgi:hypothetical protein
MDANEGRVYGNVSNSPKQPFAHRKATDSADGDMEAFVPILNVGTFDVCFNRLGTAKLEMVTHEVASFTFAVEILADREIQGVKFCNHQLHVSKQDLLDASERAKTDWLNPSLRKELIQTYIESALQILRGDNSDELICSYFNLWLITWMSFLGAEPIAKNIKTDIFKTRSLMNRFLLLKWESKLTSYSYLRESNTQFENQTFWIDGLANDLINLIEGSRNRANRSDIYDSTENHQLAIRSVSYIMERKNSLLKLCEQQIAHQILNNSNYLSVANCNAITLVSRQSAHMLQKRLKYHYFALRSSEQL